ncbi:MAG: PfkB family carbohydrate kinase, partial [Erysipelothrix sp.]
MKRVLAFGEVMMRLGVSDHKLLQQTSQLDYLFSGTGVNILSGLSHMGHETSLITALPDNRVGEVATGKLREMGIGTDMIQYEGDHIGIYILETGYGARPSQVTYLNRSMSSFATFDYNKKIQDFDTMFKGVEMLHICGIALIHDNTYKMALKLIDEAKQRNVKIIFDCNYRASLWENHD